jgi:hypothetical protein
LPYLTQDFSEFLRKTYLRLWYIPRPYLISKLDIFYLRKINTDSFLYIVSAASLAFDPADDKQNLHLPNRNATNGALRIGKRFG